MNRLEKIDLGSGITLNYMNTDKFKTDYLSVNFILPLTAYNAAHAALLPRVLIRGSAEHPSNRALAIRSEELYSADITQSTYKFGNLININFTLESLAGKYTFDSPELFEDCVALLSEIIFSPLVLDDKFKEDYVELEKKNQLIAIEAKKNNKSAYAVQRCVEIACEGESFAIPASGRKEDVELVTPESLYSFYRSLLEKTSIEVFYFGAEHKNNVEACLKKTIAATLDRQVEVLFGNMLCDAKIADVKNVKESVSAKQGKLVMALRNSISVASPEYVAFSVFNCLLSDSPVSKLFVNVREKLGLCYYCGTVNESSVGLSFVTAGIKNENADIAAKEITNQISNISEGNITAEELSAAKKTMINLLSGMYDNPLSVESWYLIRKVNSAQESSPEEFAEAVKSVTAEQVMDIARRLRLDTVFLLEGGLGGDCGEDDSDEEYAEGEE